MRLEPAPAPAAGEAAPYRFWTDTVYLRSWAAVFLSMSGTFFLLLSISTVVYERTGSAFWSSAVFGSQWTLAILSPPLIAFLARRFRVIPLLAGADAVAAVLVVAAGLAFEGSLLLCLALLALHGVLEALNKSLRVLPLKAHVPPSQLKKAVAYFTTAQYLASTLGAAIGILAVGSLSILQIAILDALTFAVSGLIYLSLGRLDVRVGDRAPGFQAMWRETWGVLAGNAELRRALLYLVAIVGLFQGFHSMARAEYAFSYLGLGHDGTMYVQVVSSLGIVLGAVVAGHLTGLVHAHRAAPWLMGLTALLCLGIFLPVGPAAMLALYFVFIMAFEIAFVVFHAEVVSECPLPSLAAVNACNMAAMTSGMMLMVYGGGLLTDATSLLFVAAATGVLGMGAAAAINHWTREAGGAAR